jgi:arginase family enzyme
LAEGKFPLGMGGEHLVSCPVLISVFMDLSCGLYLLPRPD